MKILHLLNTATFSGAENVVCQIIGMMKDNPNMEMVYCSREGKIREALAERNITFVPIADLTKRELKRIINEQTPDIIHAHDMRAGLVAACACGKIPLISHIHNNAFDSRGLSLKSIAYFFAAQKAKHIFWVSKSACNGYAFHKKIADKSSVLYNIIDIDALYQKMQTDKNEYSYDVVFLGRLTYPKNPQRLIEVFRRVAEKAPTIKMAIIGTGELEVETKQLVTNYHLEKSVSFLGFQSNPLKILRDSKVMVMTSRWEGTPMCALEALALGVPIVSTPTDGLQDIVKPGKTGYLSDNDESLASKIIQIVTDPKLHRELSQNAITFSKHFNDCEAYTQQIMGIYKSILEESK